MANEIVQSTDEELAASIRTEVQLLSGLLQQAAERKITVQIDVTTREHQNGTSIPAFAVRGAWKQVLSELLYIPRK
jgi:hypothetical protein